MALTMGLMLAAAPPEKAGSVASISETGGEFGIALGIATLGSLGTIIYRNQLVDTVPPASLPRRWPPPARASRLPQPQLSSCPIR